MERQEIEAELDEVERDLAEIERRARSAAKGIRRVAMNGGADDIGQVFAVLAADRLVDVKNAAAAVRRFLAPLWPNDAKGAAE